MNLKYARWWNLDAARDVDAARERERVAHWWDLWSNIGRVAFWRLQGRLHTGVRGQPMRDLRPSAPPQEVRAGEWDRLP